MAKLTAAARKSLPTSSFGLPHRAKSAAGKARTGSWPMPDKSHARFALSQVGRSLSKGNISSGEASRIRAKANRILGRADGGAVVQPAELKRPTEGGYSGVRTLPQNPRPGRYSSLGLLGSVQGLRDGGIARNEPTMGTLPRKSPPNPMSNW